jgi:conjugal transfer pilus assembly protein TraV
MRSKVLLAALIAILSGCTSWSGSYSCQGYPETVQCKSAREVYELTNYRDSLEKNKGQDADCPECGDSGNPGNAGNPGNPRYLTPAAAASTEAVQGLGYTGPMPLRSQAKIMRVWVAPWEGTDGALHMPSYLYAEVEDRRWSIGEKRMEVAPAITPLLDRTMPDSPPQAKRVPARPPAKGQNKPDLSDLTLPKENPHPAPTLDTSIKKTKNTPQNAFFDRKTGQMKKDNYFGTD